MEPTAYKTAGKLRGGGGVRTPCTLPLDPPLRMSWSVSEILKPFKEICSRVLSGLKAWGETESFLNLTIHSFSFFKQCLM